MIQVDFDSSETFPVIVLALAPAEINKSFMDRAVRIRAKEIRSAGLWMFFYTERERKAHLRRVARNSVDHIFSFLDAEPGAGSPREARAGEGIAMNSNRDRALFGHD